MSPYVRTVNAASGATAVQIVYSSRRGSRDIEHIGSAHDDAEQEAACIYEEEDEGLRDVEAMCTRALRVSD